MKHFMTMSAMKMTRKWRDAERRQKNKFYFEIPKEISK